MHSERPICSYPWTLCVPPNKLLKPMCANNGLSKPSPKDPVEQPISRSVHRNYGWTDYERVWLASQTRRSPHCRLRKQVVFPGGVGTSESSNLTSSPKRRGGKRLFIFFNEIHSTNAYTDIWGGGSRCRWARLTTNTLLVELRLVCISFIFFKLSWYDFSTCNFRIGRLTSQLFKSLKLPPAMVISGWRWF